MAKRLTEAEKNARAKAAAEKKEARAEAAKKREYMRIKKHMDTLMKYQKADYDRIVPGVTAHELTVYAGRVRALSDRIQEAVIELKKVV
jgi:hypothetical protein